MTRIFRHERGRRASDVYRDKLFDWTLSRQIKNQDFMMQVVKDGASMTIIDDIVPKRKRRASIQKRWMIRSTKPTVTLKSGTAFISKFGTAFVPRSKFSKRCFAPYSYEKMKLPFLTLWNARVPIYNVLKVIYFSIVIYMRKWLSFL